MLKDVTFEEAKDLEDFGACFGKEGGYCVFWKADENTGEIGAVNMNVSPEDWAKVFFQKKNST